MSQTSLTVSILLSTALARYGGLETCAREFARGLSARGHRVSLIAGSPRAARSDNTPGMAIVAVPCPQISQLGALRASRPAWLPTAIQALLFFATTRASRAARHALAASDVTITFLEPETTLFSSYLKSRRVPNVSYFAGGMSWFWFQRDQSALRVAISRSLADFVGQTHGIPCDGAVTPGIPSNWLDTPMPQVRVQPNNLVYIGRLEENKGVWLLAAMADQLRKTFPALQIRLIGSGPLESELRKHSPALQLEGIQSHEQIVSVLRESDVFVFPSHYESFGIAALEAQAVGVPVVASDLPALREATGGAAIFLPPDDADAWVAALSDLILDPARRESLARAGRAHAATATWEIAAAKLEQFLLLAATRTAPHPSPRRG
jgi:glycosyltransferase involved in cell wall biosynthesis